MTDLAIEPRDEQVAEALVAGRSVRAVRKQFGLTTAELDARRRRPPRARPAAPGGMDRTQ